MKLDARSDLPVYPVLKAQSPEKRCENILQKQKTQHQNSPILGVQTRERLKNNRRVAINNLLNKKI